MIEKDKINYHEFDMKKLNKFKFFVLTLREFDHDLFFGS
ncbi:hypothetical protein LEP1GSC109_4911 [Leptospira interrogans str. UI 13372]|uniref:Uncharacterized protein n=1 Tax=Leptospira interrogans str. UI 12621 TaxID=1049937 RepID=A0A0F6HBQ4_LEPIR|nr:hypothetical protein LEP1GSC104_4862 [Leptospira interrogans str. UI 12621]EMO94467.1 hypothetical protein LEP1GSC109_4911 [Leptospira interrogans str. UI 13372]